MERPYRGSMGVSTVRSYVYSTLMSNRLIEIYVGTREVPYLVSQVALCSASEYFVKAIKNEHLGTGNIGVLKFPEDKEDEWKVLLFWIINRELPTIDHFPGFEHRANKPSSGSQAMQQILYQCWILADKYFMPRLQNAVMKKLLYKLDEEAQCMTAADNALRSHTTGSIIGRLACEGVVELVYGGAAAYKPDDLDVLDGIPGAIASIANTLERFNKKAIVIGEAKGKTRQWRRRNSPTEIWREFMVPE